MDMIKFYHEIKNPSICHSYFKALEINKYWLGGFVDGDATFSANLNRPRFKFENHVKELPLFTAIVKYFKYGDIIKLDARRYRINSSEMVYL